MSIRSDAGTFNLAAALRVAKAEFGADSVGADPEVSDQALKKLKFVELLPPRLATDTLSPRNADNVGAAAVAQGSDGSSIVQHE